LVVDPMLRSISRSNDGRLDPRPQPGSPAFSTPITPPNNGFYDLVAFKGAFGRGDIWLYGWTAVDAYGLLPPRTNTVIVAGNITSNVTWHATNEYILDGKIYVLNNAVLTIEPGTVIKGKTGTPGDPNTVSALFVTRGAKIFAEGTRTRPIIFTSDQDDVNDPEDLPIFQRGLWGGLVILGNAVLNTSLDAAGNAASPKYDVFEGLPDLQINGQYVYRYGGNDDNDNSGVLRYVSIRHAGFKITTDKELNGLTLACVGRGTTVEHVEIYAAADDGVEFFGGTVNTKYLVSAFNDDDGFDVDQGYRGMTQFLFVIQEPGVKDNGGEWNGDPKELVVSNAPLARFEIYNATFIGAGTGTTGNRGLLVRDYAAPTLRNSILTDFGGPGINVDPDSGWFLTNGLIRIDNNLWWNFAGQVAETANARTYLFDDASRSNLVVDPMLRSISRSNDGRLDPRPQPGSPAFSTPITPPNNGFYDQVAFKGAFSDLNWASSWTALSEYGILSAAGGGQPIYVNESPAMPKEPVLTIALDGASAKISFNSEAGYTYTLESAATLTDVWTPVSGAAPSNPQVGTGDSLLFAVPVESTRFFRVKVQ